MKRLLGIFASICIVALLSSLHVKGYEQEGPDQAQLLEKVMQLMQQDKHNEALNVLNTVLQDDPNSAAAYYLRGMLHGHLKKFDLSIIDLTRVIRLDSKFKDAYYARSQALTRLLDSSTSPGELSRKVVPLAIIDMQKYEELSGGLTCSTPKCARAFHALAFLYYSSREYEQSCKYGRRAKELGYIAPFFGSSLDVEKILPVACTSNKVKPMNETWKG